MTPTDTNEFIPTHAPDVINYQTGSQDPSPFTAADIMRLLKRSKRPTPGAFGLGPTDRAASKSRRTAAAEASIAAQIAGETPSTPETT